ncbi:hypothetical protein BDZ89DRAFT_1060683 [Hymenopellis radicata]|nr:hypothetical protein BDZ89DRAFT_1060683 [Hymenopellis radicata]
MCRKGQPQYEREGSTSDGTLITQTRTKCSNESRLRRHSSKPMRCKPDASSRNDSRVVSVQSERSSEASADN